MTTDTEPKPKTRVEEILEGIDIEAIQQRVQEQTTRDVVSHLAYSVQNEVSKEVQAYFTEHVRDEVRKRLEEQREMIVVAIVSAVEAALEGFKRKLAETAQKNLDGYKMRKILGEMFGQSGF